MSSAPNQPRRPRGVPTGGEFTAQVRTEAPVDLSVTAASDDPFDGYRLTKVKRMSGREGPAYSAVLTRDGRAVADVAQDGNGGSTFIRFRGGRRGEDAAHFEATAGRLALSTYEPDSALVDRLETVDEMNRKKTVAFTLDGDDPFGEGEDPHRWGTYHQYPKGMPFDDAVRNLAGPAFAGANPKVWVPERAAFVPVSQLTGEPS